MPRNLPTGIVKTASGFRVWQRIHPGPHGLKSKRFPRTATLTDMQHWREDQRTEGRKPKPITEQPVMLTGFAAEAATYLQAVRAMPSFKDRARDIADWLIIFGDQPTQAITAAAIRTARDQWLTVGPKRVLEKARGQKATWVNKPLPLAASTVNHRLRALENFFTVLHPDQPNPVRAVPEAHEPPPEPRGHTFALALEVLSYMPDVTKPVKGGTHEPGSLSRVRFEAMLWTGLPAVQLARLKPELVDWRAQTVLVPRRQKGKHSRRARTRQDQPRPLLPMAIAALKRFFALQANRQFSTSALAHSVKRAIRAANRERATRGRALIPESIRVYDLTRHTFGTEAMRASQNLKAVQDLMGHADINQTSRYAMAAVREGNRLAVRQLAASARKVTTGNLSPLKVSLRERSRRVRARKPA